MDSAQSTKPTVRYRVNQFILRFFREAFMPPFELKEVMRQCYEVGVRSFTLIP
jgi:phospholipid/cholesterol/gamma-HCH transport system permease protein